MQKCGDAFPPAKLPIYPGVLNLKLAPISTLLSVRLA
jgi:hypothetical protein